MADWFVYVIQSELDGSYYTGHTHDLWVRLTRHNDGWTQSTKAKRPWRLVYSEHYGSKSEAAKRELQIKRMKSREYLERIISHAGGRPDPDSTRKR